MRATEPWDRRDEAFDGETVLADLRPGLRTVDATLILARFTTLRAMTRAGRATLDSAADRAAARDYLDALPATTPERRWLIGVLASVRTGKVPSAATVARLAAAASSADRAGHLHGAFALHRAAYGLASREGWHVAAGRCARALARACGARAPQAHRLWSGRALTHERRAAA